MCALRAWAMSAPGDIRANNIPGIVTPTELMIDVPGEAIPQGSLKAVSRGKYTALVSDNPRLKAWRNDVLAAAAARMRLTGWATVDAPVIVTIDVWLPRPAAARKRARPHVRPDLDKLARSCLDALTTAQVYADDSRVVELRARKFYASEDSGVRITVTTMED